MHAIKVENVSKSFRIPHEKKTTLFEHLANLVTYSGAGNDELWALKNISFQLEHGETLGIIGRNGSGKSTLLKVISRIYPPTSGTVTTHGRLVPFIELGVGFKSDLTGKENVYLYGSILGLTRAQIDSKYKEIVEFAEIERFMDTKLKNYSTGMQVRLAFSTAIQTNPDILLIDEVLAVGDMAFQEKCLDVMKDYINKGKSIILVSHDLSSVRRFCKNAMLMENGVSTNYGECGKVIDAYTSGIEQIRKTQEVKGARWGTKEMVITDINILDSTLTPKHVFNTGDRMTVRIHFSSEKRVLKPIVGIRFYNSVGQYVFGACTEHSGFEIKYLNDRDYLDIVFPNLMLGAGTYFVTVAVASKDYTHYDWINQNFTFEVATTDYNRELGAVLMPHRWVLKNE